MDEGASAAAELGEQGEVGLRELADGIQFWRSRRGWPADFDNADYELGTGEPPRPVLARMVAALSQEAAGMDRPPGP